MALLNPTKTRPLHLRIRLPKLPTLQLGTWWQRARTPTHTYAGFACITTAAYTTLPQLGWLTAGIALLALEYLGGTDNSGRP